MAVKYKDYYEILGVQRNASQEEIHRVYRKLARKYHPDINKNKGAEDRFKEIGEAYEVLKEPEKRKKYDELGSRWTEGQDFTPPPGWDFHTGGFDGNGNQGFHFGGFGPGASAGSKGFAGSTGFSEFFNVLFGEDSPFGGGSASIFTQDAGFAPNRGADQEAILEIPLEEAYAGGRKTIKLERTDTSGHGPPASTVRRLEVRIPAGVTDGHRLRLSGQGGKGPEGRPNGDLYLKIHILPHPKYRLKVADMETVVPVSPWEAALGAKIQVPTLGGPVALKLPPGIRSEQKIRIKGRGLARRNAKRGDLYVIIRIDVPKNLEPKERELFEQLSKISSFHPRG